MGISTFSFILQSSPGHSYTRGFGVKLNVADESGTPSYGKVPLRGPPVQGLHENLTYGSNTPKITCTHKYFLNLICNSMHL